MTTTAPRPSATLETDLRNQLSNLQGLLMLSMLMTQSGDGEKILHLAETSVPSFGRCHLVGTMIDRHWMPAHSAELSPQQQIEVGVLASSLPPGGGELDIPGHTWAKALPLRSLKSHVGFLVVGAREHLPSGSEQFLFQVLAQQTGIALVNAQLHASERSTAAQLREANETLAETVRVLERTTDIHVRFTRVAAANEGQDGIARALYELTGFPVAVEDRYGNLRAWAGPDRPDPYPKDPGARREQMLRRAMKEGRPIREGGRLVAIANPASDVIGVLALIDPGSQAGDQETIAMEHGATVLAMELAKLRSLAETELRLRRDLVDELLAGTDETSALARAQALGHDLERPHRVAVIEGNGRVHDANAFFMAVRRVARQLRAGSLMVARGETVVLLSDCEVAWEKFRDQVLTDLGGGRCRIGVGDFCQRPADFPRSYHEAQLALRVQRTVKASDRATTYADLGVYRILAEAEDPDTVDRFVQRWLGRLLEYDAQKGAELVHTLSRYLECGGSYEATANTLAVHRSTLKYRLQRIREISGLDIGDPDIAFNLQLATRGWETVRALKA
ncbi:PucR family transcriptional regulator [Nocardioides pocheonensis]|uniref:CdaR family transcriptional regulator n=1 Tax=Nocardioides pocheonensis TaxID=661485 RepID=A0A3N0GIA4_9ACTN|nr:helix-turn-helix domain-containing protein [Nocardioides pocheonensis]RNM12204.1 CdaR family transcriptional regulator [Nocardioides pocheonensis]